MVSETEQREGKEAIRQVGSIFSDPRVRVSSPSMVKSEGGYDNSNKILHRNLSQMGRATIVSLSAMPSDT
jgi:hypothetical protein